MRGRRTPDGDGDGDGGGGDDDGDGDEEDDADDEDDDEGDDEEEEEEDTDKEDKDKEEQGAKRPRQKHICGGCARLCCWHRSSSIAQHLYPIRRTSACIVPMLHSTSCHG